MLQVVLEGASCLHLCELISTTIVAFHGYNYCLASSWRIKTKNYSLLHQKKKKKKTYFCKKNNRHLPSLGLTLLNLSFHSFQILSFQLFSQIHLEKEPREKEKIQEVSHPPYRYEWSSTFFRYPHFIFQCQLTNSLSKNLNLFINQWKYFPFTHF